MPHSSKSSSSSKPKRTVPYLVRVNGAWAFRRRYPLDVRQYVDTECFFKRLESRDFVGAKREAEDALVDFNHLVDNIRQERGLRRPYRLTDEDAARLAARVPAMVLAMDEVDRQRGISREELAAYRSQVNHHLQVAADAALTLDREAVEPLANLLLEQEGLRLSPVAPAYDTLLRHLLEAQRQAMSLLAQRLQGHTVPTPQLAIVPGGEDDCDVFDRALEHWQKERAPAAKTLDETRLAFKRLQQFSGVNRISQLNPRVLVAFRAHLRDKLQLKSGSVKKTLSLLSAVVAQLVEDSLAEANPFAGIRKPKGNDATRVESLSPEQLSRIFRSPVYAERLRPVRGGGEAAFWLPLLALYTGARLEELGQLRLCDVEVRSGTLVLNIREVADAALSVKNDESIRLVPVHATLRACGFDDYLRWCKQNGHTRLFPGLKQDRYRKWTSGFSRWWGRYFDEVVGIDDPAYTFHSLRHMFKQFARACGISDSLIDELQGHAPASVGGGYGRGQPIDVLDAALKKFSVPGLDVSHLRWTPPSGSEPKRLRRAGKVEAEHSASSRNA
jgi:integrase